MHIPTLIEKKRDGAELSAEEIGGLISAFTRGEMADYQMSAWAMAVFFRGMTAAETRQLTTAMMESGRVLSYPAGSPPKVDKHSTGGVGDKVSLILAPLLACDDVWVPMISGRGLGLTGGTLDKLESIPGFNVNLDEGRALAQLERIGVFMIGQTADICPADKKLYALRDVTGTVPSQPLIVASIMSKKLAENLDRLVLDVKFGAGAFMKTRGAAEELAAAMKEVGELMGVRMSCRLTPMDEPLGRAVGNALEVAECVEVLHGGGPQDLIELTLDLASQVANASREQLARWLADGSAWRKFVELVEAQDGDAAALENLTRVHAAPIRHPLLAKQDGTVQRMDAEAIGRASVLLGGGRQRAEDAVDFAVGFSEIKKVGETVAAGEPLLIVHARSEESLAGVLPLLDRSGRNFELMRRALLLFLLGGLALVASAREPVPTPSPDSAATRLIPWLLEEKENLTQMPLSEVIFAATGKKVLAIDRDDATDQRVLKQLRATLDTVVEKMNAPESPIQSTARINEVSSSFEAMIRELLNAAPGLACDYPKTAEGRVQRSGYPDLRLVDTASGRVYYLDPKLFADKSRTSSLRTFYYEPKLATNKVRDDAVHLILGFEHGAREAGHWEFTRWDVVDLSTFKVKLKAEFQGSNRDMYRPEAIVATSAE